jgi:hypothetical protein
MLTNKILLKTILENHLREEEQQQQSADQGLSAGLSGLKSGLSGLKGYKAPQPKKEDQLDESVGSLVASGLLAAPKLIEWLGKAVSFIAKKFTGKSESEAGKGIEKFGKKWEGLYVGIIEQAIKLTGFLQDQWQTKDGKTDKEKLHLIAKVIYAIVLGVALVSAVKGILNPHSVVMASLEAVLGSVKAVEIAGIVKLVLPKFGITAA